MAIWVELRDATVAREGRVLLAGASWRIGPGDRWALWGPNGAGKSTLLQVVAGLRTVDAGSRVRQPGLRVAWVPQEPRLPAASDLDGLVAAGSEPVRAAEATLRVEERRWADAAAAGEDGAGEDGAADPEDPDAPAARYQRALDRFEALGGWRARERLRRELAEALPDRPGSTPLHALGAGERRRAATVLAFAERPDLLLLDEPSHDLDAAGRERLTRRLASWPREAAWVLASHDRELLGRAANRSARLEGGALDARALPFDRHRDQLGIAQRGATHRARVQERERARLESAAARIGRPGSPATAAAARSLRVRAARVGSRSPSGGTDPLLAPPSADAAPAWTLPDARPARGTVLRAEHLRADGLFDDVRLVLEAGDAVAILADERDASGALLAMLGGTRRSDDPRGSARLTSGLRAHVWDAERRGLDDRPIAEQLAERVRAPRVASLLALVGLPHERGSARPSELSGGERARAASALLIAREPDVVLADRPERDLDLPGLERLERALADASATVVLATADARLADAVSDDVRTFEDGRLVAWRGGVRGWRGRRRRTEPEAAGTAFPAGAATLAEQGGATDEARAAPEADRSGTDEATVAAWEDRQVALEEALADPDAFSERDRARAERTVRALEEARMRAYDARQPAPAPRYRARRGPLVATADRAEGPDAEAWPLTFVCPDWPAVPTVRRAGAGVLLSLSEPEAGCWTSWAWEAAVLACLDLIVPVLDPEVVQVRAPEDRPSAPPPPFVRVDARWWAATRDAWLADAGFADAEVADAGSAATARPSVGAVS